MGVRRPTVCKWIGYYEAAGGAGLLVTRLAEYSGTSAAARPRSLRICCAVRDWIVIKVRAAECSGCEGVCRPRTGVFRGLQKVPPRRLITERCWWRRSTR